MSQSEQGDSTSMTTLSRCFFEQWTRRGHISTPKQISTELLWQFSSKLKKHKTTERDFQRNEHSLVGISDPERHIYNPQPHPTPHWHPPDTFPFSNQNEPPPHLGLLLFPLPQTRKIENSQNIHQVYSLTQGALAHLQIPLGHLGSRKSERFHGVLLKLPWWLYIHWFWKHRCSFCWVNLHLDLSICASYFAKDFAQRLQESRLLGQHVAEPAVEAMFFGRLELSGMLILGFLCPLDLTMPNNPRTRCNLEHLGAARATPLIFVLWITRRGVKGGGFHKSWLAEFSWRGNLLLRNMFRKAPFRERFFPTSNDGMWTLHKEPHKPDSTGHRGTGKSSETRSSKALSQADVMWLFLVRLATTGSGDVKREGDSERMLCN